MTSNSLKKQLPDNTPTDKNTSSEKTDGETGGPQGPEPTRYGDWEVKGRVSDF